MNKTFSGIVAGLAIGAAATWLALKHGGESGPKHEEEPPEESRVIRTNGTTFIKLDAEAVNQAGLKLAPLQAARLKPAIKGFGRVLDPAPLATQVTQLATAEAALQSSTREFQRLKILHAQDQNVSTRVLEAAESTVVRDQIAAEAARLALLGSWGQAIASQPDLPALVRSLASLETALARIDLPLGTVLGTMPVGGRIVAVNDEGQAATARLLGPAPAADAQTQSQGFLFLLSNRPFTPGTALAGWLTVPGDERAGVFVPRDAVVRHEGAAFVYSREGDDLFRRQRITLDEPLDQGWFITGELKPQEEIVITGAQQLLSEELRSQGGNE